MQVYKARKEDIDEIVSIYNLAVDHMYKENNTNQWQKNNELLIPSLLKYINEDNFYVVKENTEIIGFFAMIFGIDQSYNDIRDGKWINNEPYVTIHKIASKYYKKGIASFILNYIINKAKENSIYNIRIDTHCDNISMNSFLIKNDFIKCGIISYTCDFNDLSTHRLAYIKELKK